MCFEGLSQKETSLSFFAKTSKDLTEKYLCMFLKSSSLEKKRKLYFLGHSQIGHRERIISGAARSIAVRD